MDDPANPKFTLSFDLLFRGMEITTGGQRIHDYQMQVNKMKSRDMDPEDFKSYLSIFKYGMPPHGGLGIGLERLTMKLLDMNNIRYASLFPRDMNSCLLYTSYRSACCNNRSNSNDSDYSAAICFCFRLVS